jgi:hypothetical protein
MRSSAASLVSVRLRADPLMELSRLAISGYSAGASRLAGPAIPLNNCRTKLRTMGSANFSADTRLARRATDIKRVCVSGSTDFSRNNDVKSVILPIGNEPGCFSSSANTVLSNSGKWGDCVWLSMASWPNIVSAETCPLRIAACASLSPAALVSGLFNILIPDPKSFVATLSV